MFMVNQKAISFKIDLDLYSDLDLYCSRYGVTRNRLLNDAVRICIMNIPQYTYVKIIANYYDLYKPRFVDGMILYDSDVI